MGLMARDVMQRDVHSVLPKMSLADLERTFCDSGQSGFPVVGDGNRLVGVVSRTDIVRKLAVEQSYAEYESAYYWDVGGPEPDDGLDDIGLQIGQRLEGMQVEDVMSHSPITVTGDTPLRDLAQILIDRKIHRLPVVEDGALVGILTSTDLVRTIADGRLG
jgi:CBS domain-containing protein